MKHLEPHIPLPHDGILLIWGGRMFRSKELMFILVFCSSISYFGLPYSAELTMVL